MNDAFMVPARLDEPDGGGSSPGGPFLGGPAAPEVPNNIPAEQALLGAVLVNNRALERADGVEAADFYFGVHGRLWQAVAETIAAGGVANPVTLKHRFAGDDALAEVGGAGYLVRLANAAVTVIDTHHYAAIVRDMARRRALIDLAETIRRDAGAVGDAGGGDAATIAEAASAELYRLTETGGARAGFVGLDQAMGRVLEQAEQAKRDGGLVGLSTGIPALDELLGGLVAPDMVVLAARPSMGKTSLGLAIARNVARAGRRVDVISAEMGADQLARRSMANAAGLAYSDIQRGRFDARGFDRLAHARTSMARLPLAILDEPGPKIGRLRTLLRRRKERDGLDLVVVDYLQLVQPDRERDHTVANVTAVSAGLKGIAKELGVPLLVLSQLSRRVEERPDKRPMLSDLRESGAIEQDADSVLFLYRDHYYEQRRTIAGEETPQRHARLAPLAHDAEVIFAKNRHGPLGTAHLWCDLATDRWRDRDAVAPATDEMEF